MPQLVHKEIRHLMTNHQKITKDANRIRACPFEVTSIFHWRRFDRSVQFYRTKLKMQQGLEVNRHVMADY
jgi:hypothetical protein